MEKRIQTWSTVKNGISTPYAGAVKSFNEYQNEIRTQKLVDKAYKDHLLSQLAVAQQAPVAVDQVKSNNEILQSIETLKASLTPVTKFFETTSFSQPKKRISAKERLKLEEEKIERELDLKAIAYLNKKGG
jgi:hypothetical protein